MLFPTLLLLQEFTAEVQQQLSRQLLRTQGCELLTELLLHLTEDPAAHLLQPQDVTQEVSSTHIHSGSNHNWTVYCSAVRCWEEGAKLILGLNIKFDWCEFWRLFVKV